MRTWLVFAAVLAVAAAAVADSVHGKLDTSAPQDTLEATPASRIVPPGVPAGFMGAVYYSDPQAGCRLKTLALPGFADIPPPTLRSCRFALSPDATQVFPGDAVWSPTGALAAVPRGKTFELASPEAHQRILVTGRAPAFKPNGTLTFSLHGRLVEWTTRCRMSDRLFTLPADNATARCARTVLHTPALSIVWLTNARFAAITGDGALVIFDGRRQVLRQPLPRSQGARVEASPKRTFFTLWRDGRLFAAYDRGGGQIAFPPLPEIHAVAWSPSERWAMLATSQGSVYLFRPNAGEARLRRLDISARDLAWR